MEIHSGYKTITPIQFANVLWALSQGGIDSQCLRVYFACFVSVAVRGAARRACVEQGKQPKQLARYRLHELKQLTQMPLRAVKSRWLDCEGQGWLRMRRPRFASRKPR